MNSAHMLLVADAIERNDRFNMNYTVGHWVKGRADKVPRIVLARDTGRLAVDPAWFGDVTAWTNVVQEADEFNVRAARVYLGLTVAQAGELFFPEGDDTVWGKDPYGMTAQLAASRMRRIANRRKAFSS